jgi:hypothetical protein
MPKFIIEANTRDADRFIDRLLELPEVKQVKKVSPKLKPAESDKPKIKGLIKRDTSLDPSQFAGAFAGDSEARKRIEKAWNY